MLDSVIAHRAAVTGGCPQDAARTVKRATLRYGADRAQVGEVWRPDTGARSAAGRGAASTAGFWRQLYTKRLMHRMAGAVVAHGWVAYNIEYRRVGTLGHGGWPEMFDDVADAIEALADVEGIDHRTSGHGRSLCRRPSGPRWPRSSPGRRDVRGPRAVSGRVCAAVSLAGVVDLAAAARRGAERGGRPRRWAADPTMSRLATPWVRLRRCCHCTHPNTSSTDRRTRPCRRRSARTTSSRPGRSETGPIRARARRGAPRDDRPTRSGLSRGRGPARDRPRLIPSRPLHPLGVPERI